MSRANSTESVATACKADHSLAEQHQKEVIRRGLSAPERVRLRSTICHTSPEGPGVPDLVELFQQLVFAVDETAIMPPEHNAGGTVDDRNIVRVPQLGHKVARDAKIVRLTQSVLDRLEQPYEGRYSIA